MVKWTLPARNDLRNISDYIAFDSKYYAKKVIADIIDLSKTLDFLPYHGRVVPEYENPNIREIFVYSYRLIYEIAESNIYILAVIHGKRDLSKLDLYETR